MIKHLELKDIENISYKSHAFCSQCTCHCPGPGHQQVLNGMATGARTNSGTLGNLGPQNSGWLDIGLICIKVKAAFT